MNQARSILREILANSNKLPDQMALKFATDLSRLALTLRKFTNFNDIDLLLDVLEVINKSKNKNLIESCWEAIIKSRVFATDVLVPYLYDAHNLSRSADNVYKLLKAFSTLKPSYGEIKRLHCSLSIIIEGVLNRLISYKIEVPENVKTLFNEFKSLEKSLINFKIPFMAKDDDGAVGNNITHPSSIVERSSLYSVMANQSILPSAKELCAKNSPVVLEANRVKGAYDNELHYFVIQYNLFREDFLRPLKQGINSITKQAEAGTDILQDRDIDVIVYENVHIVAKSGSRSDGVMYKLQFIVNKNVQWCTSKRLPFGALLCLFIREDFTLPTEVIFATVTRRKVDDLEEGYVEITVEYGDEQYLEAKYFIMVESEAFFEAYKHVLEGLKDLYHFHYKDSEQNKDDSVTADSNTKLPFLNNIVYADCNVKQIKALRETPDMRYNFRSLFSEECASKFTSFDEPTYRLPHYETWPSPSELGLDESQRKALHLALTREISLIQGPPGTGKTFIGLKAIQMLLNNIKCWNGLNESGGNILVVCYTNHALDQFLEGILDLLQRGKVSKQCKHPIIRIGSRSKSDRLVPHTINNLRRTSKRNKEGRNINKFCEELEGELQNLYHKICLSDGELISGDELVNEKVLSLEIYQQIKSQTKDMTLIDWLFQIRSISECIGNVSKQSIDNENNSVNRYNDEDEFECERKYDNELENRFNIASTRGQKLLEFKRNHLNEMIRIKKIDKEEAVILTDTLQTIFDEHRLPSDELLQKAADNVWSIRNILDRSILYSYWQSIAKN